MFITELILAILFFSIAAACCLQVFARADLLARKAQQLKLAVGSTENLAALLKECEGNLQQLQQFYPETDLAENSELYFDGDGTVCDRENSWYSIRLSPRQEDGITYVTLSCLTTEQEELLNVTVTWYGEEKNGEE
jgi:hypothetical protein